MPRSNAHAPLLWIVASGFFMQTLDTTIVNTALPAIARDLGVPPLTLKPVVVAYMITMAMIMPASGWLADRYGSRKVYFTAILAFVLGSFLCACSATPTQLVMARVVQGAGASMLLPVGRLTVLRTVSPSEFISALAFIAIGGQIGPIFGPVLGGVFVETLSWHWIFLINVPVGLIGMWAVRHHMPAGVREDTPPFDFVGCVLLATCLVAFSTALDLPAESHRGAWAAALLALSVLSALGYYLHARGRSNPLFPLSLFRETNYAVGIAGNLVCRIGAAAVPFLLPLMMQLGMGYTPLHSGLMLVPVAAAGAVSKSWVAPMIKRYGYPRFLIFNTLFVGFWIISFALFSRDWPLWLQIVQLAAFGLGNSMQYSAMNSVALTSLSPQQAGAGNSLFAMFQMVAMGLGVTVGGALVTLLAGPERHLEPAFAWSFVCVGLITWLSALVWRRLDGTRLAAVRQGPKAA
ncbi:MFS transporter [Bordetella bronchialis]|uniref:EmrB/QacA subfamily drug resistance transporter n=1 Tax=Bordetella bronchialis TaxID=463025 RepID=A0A193FVM8_9BORD|nr:MFS transporter [Bordetella bronchialis]ANN71690.1 EmrB/QacA subfamily drug resistance transporter [Bordetella bronchialis]